MRKRIGRPLGSGSSINMTKLTAKMRELQIDELISFENETSVNNFSMLFRESPIADVMNDTKRMIRGTV